MTISRPCSRIRATSTCTLVTSGQVASNTLRYYTSREVDIRAEPMNDVQLVFPRLAYQNRTKGLVVLRILINERGAIDDLAVVESHPKGIFEEAALSATRTVKFSPAIRNGRTVKSQKTIEVAFDPYESIHIP
jgi:TonB family protein